MKIVYFGTDVFLNVFHYLRENHEIVALYTYHQDEDYFTERNIVEEAEQADIPVHYKSIDAQTIMDFIEKDGVELFLMAEYNRIIPVPDRKVFRAVNFHSSLLPEGRSYYPIEKAMEAGSHVTGITLHKAENRVDHGAIMMQRPIVIEPCDDSVDIYLKCAGQALEIIKEVMPSFEQFWNAAKEQDRIGEYWKRPEESNLWIDHDLTIQEVMHRFRNYNKLCMVQIGKKRYYVNDVHCGQVMPSEEVLWITDQLVHFRLKDGYARIFLEKVNERYR